MSEIAGYACLEAVQAGVAGLLEFGVDDVSLLDAPAFSICQHQQQVSSGSYRMRGGMPCVAFRFQCSPLRDIPASLDLALSARLLTEPTGQGAPRRLRAGDFTTTERTTLDRTARQPLQELHLRRIG